MSSSQIDQPAQTDQPTLKKPLRLWPGVAAVVLQWLLWFVVPRLVSPEAAMFALFGGVICGLAVVVWWLFFSRAPWLERVGVIVFMVVAVIATKRIVHPSIAGGMMGMMLPILSIPMLCFALVAAAAVANRRLGQWPRRGLIAVAIVLGCGAFTLIRTGGITGDAHSDLHWRWTRSPEERLLAQGDELAASSLNSNSATTPAVTSEGTKQESGWPGFRGPNRDGVVHGMRIESNWSTKPPVAMWRQPVGPGWSSFAVSGSLFYTQEQRGNDEVVSCYDLNTGKPGSRHRGAAQFWGSNAGAGPRGAPTLSNGRVYAFGAAEILNALDARNGTVVWSRNAAADTKAKVPIWGFGSPLVVGDVVIVATAGALAGYEVANGNPRWSVASSRGGYSSRTARDSADVVQVLLMNGEGVTSVAPADARCSGSTPEGDSIAAGHRGRRRPARQRPDSAPKSACAASRVTHGPGGWIAAERWTSIGLKPYFNASVIHKELPFGFEGSNLACIDLKHG